METEFKGTPGHWVADGYHIKVKDSFPHALSYVQHIMTNIDNIPDTVGLSNAQLMATSPELLQMCIDTRQLLEPMIDNPASRLFMKQLNDVINKALNPKL